MLRIKDVLTNLYKIKGLTVISKGMHVLDESMPRTGKVTGFDDSSLKVWIKWHGGEMELVKVRQLEYKQNPDRLELISAA